MKQLWVAAAIAMLPVSAMWRVSAQAPAPTAAPAVPIGAPSKCAGPGRAGGMGAGRNDTPVVDAAAADRGRRVYAAQCINCHGTQARGSDSGANLVRSVLVLHDRCGSELEPFLKKGHSLQSGAPASSLTSDQITDLAHFIRQRVNDTLRGSPIFEAQNVLTGDAKAGLAFFNGPGGCTACHSPTAAPLAGIGTRLTPINIQQRFLFPPGPGRGGRGAPAPSGPSPTAVRVTVTPAGGAAVSGVLVQMDDFSVALRDETGAYRSFRRSPALKVEKTVPLAAHIALLETITDKQIHDVVAYLETLK
jgi:mono/diheme cytochrome c family protein